MSRTHRSERREKREIAARGNVTPPNVYWRNRREASLETFDLLHDMTHLIRTGAPPEAWPRRTARFMLDRLDAWLVKNDVPGPYG